MSKRAGTIVTLDELIDEVGVDAARFTLLSSSNDSAMNFDIEVVKQQTMENPVYYVQYGHARIASILRKAAERGVELRPIEDAELSLLVTDAELALLRALADAPAVIAKAAACGARRTASRTPRRIWPAAFHRFYTECRVLSEDPALTQARLWLCAGYEAGAREPARAPRASPRPRRWNGRMTEAAASRARPSLGPRRRPGPRRRGVRARRADGRRGRRPRSSPTGSAPRSWWSTRTTCVRGVAAAAADRRPRALRGEGVHGARRDPRSRWRKGWTCWPPTGGEVEACLRAGAPAGRIVLHGNNKSDEELALAVGARLALVVADGPDELRAPGRGRARVGAGAGRAPARGPRRGGAHARGDRHGSRGIEVRHAARRRPSTRCGRAAPSPRSGSKACRRTSARRCQQAESYVRALDTLVDLAARVRAEAGAEVPDARRRRGLRGHLRGRGGAGAGGRWRTVLATRLRERCAERRDCRFRRWSSSRVAALVAEPRPHPLPRGRDEARRRARTLVAVDGGMSDNLRPMLYDARFTVAAGGAAHARVRQGASPSWASTASRATSSPRAWRCRRTSRRGDLLAFAATGAYTYALASAYNRVGRPAVVAVRAGRATPWLRREDAADMDRLELAAPRHAPRRSTLPRRHHGPGGARARTPSPFLDFWTAVVAEGRYVRSERVAHPAARLPPPVPQALDRPRGADRGGGGRPRRRPSLHPA